MNEKMVYNPDIHHRRSIRLKGYDYSRSGAYFITICTRNRECLFGEIENGEMRLNEFGDIVQTCWKWLGLQYEYVGIDQFVLMPNHIHGILILDDNPGDPVGAVREPPLRDTAYHRDAARQRDTACLLLDDNPGDPVGAVREPPLRDTAYHRDTARQRDAPPLRPGNGKPRKSIGRLVGAYKTVSSKQINQIRGTPGLPMWQRNYYEHIIRDDQDYMRITEYIMNNPLQWEMDENYPPG